MNDAARQHVFRLRRIGFHVRRDGVRLEVILALPLLDHHEAVRAELGLEAADALGVGRA